MATITFKLSNFTRKNEKELVRDLKGTFVRAILSAANQSVEEFKIRFVVDADFVTEENFSVFNEAFQVLPKVQYRRVLTDYIDIYKFKWVFENSDGEWSDSVFDLWRTLRNNGVHKGYWMEVQIKNIRYIGRETIDRGLRK